MQMGRIIGHDTETRGLYNIAEIDKGGHAMLTQVSLNEKIWMWHKRLGHPSLGYLKHLFPCIKSSKVFLNCEACVLAKSHRHWYSSNSSYSDNPLLWFIRMFGVLHPRVLHMVLLIF